MTNFKEETINDCFIYSNCSRYLETKQYENKHNLPIDG